MGSIFEKIALKSNLEEMSIGSMKIRYSPGYVLQCFAVQYVCSILGLPEAYMTEMGLY